jgi:hypothetical protein
MMSQNKVRSKTLLAGATVLAVCQTSAMADISGFSGFAPVNTLSSNSPTTNSDGYTGGTVFKINDGAGNEATSGFAAAAQSVSGFTATFTYQVIGTTNSSTNQFALGDGFDFVIQNDPRGTAAVGGNGGSKGYAYSGAGSPAAVGPSAAVSFEVYNGNTTAFLNTAAGSTTTTTTNQQTTFYNGGFTGAHNLPALTNGDPINITVTYAGTTLTESLFDTVNHGTFNTSYTNVNLPALVGGSSALVGFSGGTGGASIAQQVSNFQFNATNGTFLPIGLTPGSFTQDGVVSAGEVAAATAMGASNLSSAVTATMDGGTSKGGDTWYEIGANPNSLTTGLPASGTPFTVAGHTFQMQSYTGNNVALVNSTTTSTTLGFSTPESESVLSLLLSAGNGPAPLSLTVNYLNGTTSTITGLDANDWFYTNFSADSAGGRVSPLSSGTSGFETDGSNPNLYELDVPLTDTTDPIGSVTVNYTGTNTGTEVMVFALSGSPAAAVPEPASATLAVAGAALLARRRRRSN